MKKQDILLLLVIFTLQGKSMVKKDKTEKISQEMEDDFPYDSTWMLESSHAWNLTHQLGKLINFHFFFP